MKDKIILNFIQKENVSLPVINCINWYALGMEPKWKQYTAQHFTAGCLLACVNKPAKCFFGANALGVYLRKQASQAKADLYSSFLQLVRNGVIFVPQVGACFSKRSAS